jgi:Flp pilus assembly protein TadB
VKGWWWDTASAERRYRFAILMFVFAVILLIAGIATRSLQYIIVALIVGPFMIVQLLRARNDRSS